MSFLHDITIFFTPGSFSGTHLCTVRVGVLTLLMHTNLKAILPLLSVFYYLF